MVTLQVVVGLLLPTLMLLPSLAHMPSYREQGSDVKALDNPHDLYKGNCTEVEGSFQMEYSVTKPANPGGFVQVFEKYWWSKPMTIYCVKMVDRIEDGSGGFPSILSGGVGANHVELGYVSQISVGLKYIVKIYYQLK